MIESWWPTAAMVALGAAAALSWRPLRDALRERHDQKARKAFHLQRERLEAKFFDLAVASGKPRGLRWADCRWQDAVTFARDRRNGRLTAFVGVAISFEAVEGGPMEDIAAVSEERVATALFHHVRGRWGTAGRALFNLKPEQALAHYREQFQPVGESNV